MRELLPICSFCKKVRDERGSWKSLEHEGGVLRSATLTHGLCPECCLERYPEVFLAKA